MKITRALWTALLMAPVAAMAQTGDPTDFAGALAKAKTDVSANLVSVGLVAVAILVVAVGFGLIMRWLPKAAKKA